jgi:hypothetical protein
MGVLGSPKPKRRWPWITAGVLVLLVIVGSLLPGTSSLTCAEINSKLHALRSDNMEMSMGYEVVKPAAEWQGNDWNTFQTLLAEITKRQNRGESCSLA